MKDKQLTGRILAACFDVSNELGHGFVESVYQRALMIALKDRGLQARGQVPLEVQFREQTVGEFVADFLVEGRVVVEITAVKALLGEHQAQRINYVNGTGIDVGLLINFGTPEVEYRRCYRATAAHKRSEQDGQDETG